MLNRLVSSVKGGSVPGEACPDFKIFLSIRRDVRNEKV
jgi:hypothetical protein